VSPEGTGANVEAVSPDGRWIVGYPASGESQLLLFPVAGGEPRAVPATGRDDPVGWSPDGQSLFVDRYAEIPLAISRVDIGTGRHEPWKSVIPPDPPTVFELSRFVMTRDASTYAYSFSRILTSDLYLVRGIR